jgi:hypothetical protein
MIVKIAAVIEATPWAAPVWPSIEHAMNNHSFIIVWHIRLIRERESLSASSSSFRVNILLPKH